MILNPEHISEISENSKPKISRRGVVIGAAATAAIAPLLLAQTVQAEEWIYAKYVPPQPGYFFPLREATAIDMGMATIYQPGGSLDTLDRGSERLLGKRTFFREQGLELAAYYDRKFFDNPQSNWHPLVKAFERSIGFCHGLVHVMILEGKLPANPTKAGILAAQHSGDRLYKPGLKQLTDGLRLKGSPFAIETITLADGIWTNAVVAVSADGTKLLTTSAGRGLKIVYTSRVRDDDVSYPVARGEEKKFPANKVYPAIDDPKALPLWTFNPNERLVNHLAYGLPL